MTEKPAAHAYLQWFKIVRNKKNGTKKIFLSYQHLVLKSLTNWKDF